MHITKIYSTRYTREHAKVSYFNEILYLFLLLIPKVPPRAQMHIASC